jgi:hypothetical protein
MVAINSIKAVPTVKDAVCPECYKPLVAPTVMDEQRHASGNTIRSYFGWCFDCNQGFAATQFFNADLRRWVLCQYQRYALLGTVQIIDPQPRQVCPMPAVPVVQTGPGGDFTQATMDKDLAASVTTAVGVMHKVATILKELKQTLEGLKKSEVRSQKAE